MDHDSNSLRTEETSYSALNFQLQYAISARHTARDSSATSGDLRHGRAPLRGKDG